MHPNHRIDFHGAFIDPTSLHMTNCRRFGEIHKTSAIGQ
jgi:hypothetical protein